MRVLMLASYFPKPGRETIGPWALDQARSLVEAGMDLRVVSLTPWLPRGVFRSEAGRAIAECPSEFSWGQVNASYPRWPYYHMEPIRRLSYPNPLPFLRLGLKAAEPGLLRVVRNFKPDIIFAHHSAVNGFVAARLNCALGIPFIVTDHSFEEIEDCRRFRRRRAVYQYVSDHASVMISVCSRMEREIKELFPSAKTRTVHNGFPSFPAELLSSPRPPSLRGKLVVFSAGVFYARKNFPLLIEVFAQVLRRNPGAVLRIAGDGVEMAAVKKRVSEYGLSEQVHLLGLVPRTEVLRELAWADVFTSLGRDEPFATVFLEALSVGLPIVCCNDGGINDILTDGIDALTVPPGDRDKAVKSLCTLLNDKNLRERIGTAARELFTRRLRADAHAAAMKSIIEDVLRGSGDRASSLPHCMSGVL